MFQPVREQIAGLVEEVLPLEEQVGLLDGVLSRQELDHRAAVKDGGLRDLLADDRDIRWLVDAEGLGEYDKSVEGRNQPLGA